MTIQKNFSKFPIFILIGLLVVFISCAANKIKKPISIPPNQAQIVGEILSIDKVDNTVSSDDFCSQYPCVATVKIKSINYGAGFPILAVNSNIKIKFAFTLVPTNSSMFPNMDKQYPGLKDGDVFTAIVAHSISINSDSPNYQIYSYSLK